MKLVDSSCIICLFNEINKPHILLDWLDHDYKIVITNHVFDELQENENTKVKLDSEIAKGNIIVQNITSNDQLIALKNRYPYLGMGELSVIQLALDFNKHGERYYAVLDDGRARKVASKLGVNLTGTYGLLKTLKQKNYIDEEHFELCKIEMSNSNFRINFNVVK
ncbi:MAG: hypothetical protein PWQ51_1815 [Methanolobus sp.]|jgi:predicted nucleic acid-binding protein|nr:hypothetical protein [Methanolobus sp.]